MKSFFDNFNNFFNETVKGYTASADFIRSQVKLMTSSVSSSNTEYVTACEYNVVEDGFYMFEVPMSGTYSYRRILVDENSVLEDSYNSEYGYNRRFFLKLNKGQNIKFQLKSGRSSSSVTMIYVYYNIIQHVVASNSIIGYKNVTNRCEAFIPDKSGHMMIICYDYESVSTTVKSNGNELLFENCNGVEYSIIQVYEGVPVTISATGYCCNYIRAFVEEEHDNGRKIVKSIQRGFVSGTPGDLKNCHIKIGAVNPLKTMVFLDSGMPSVLYVDRVEKNALVIGSHSTSTDSTNSTTIHYQIIEFW